jgi:hypothetical protein
MKRNTWNSLLFVGMISLTVACKTKKLLVVAPPVTKTEIVTDKKAENLKLLAGNDLSFRTLALKGKANLDINGSANNVGMTIRMEKDKVIWVSVTSIIGEVARVLITPDSIKIRNNFQSVYLQKPFRYIHSFTSKQVDFTLLQAVLSGNTVDRFMTLKSNLDLENGVWVLKGRQETLSYEMLFNTLLKVAETNLNDVNSGQALKVVYGDYQKVLEELFPSSTKISSMSGTRKINVNLDFSKIERNVPLEFPFSVPKKYEVIN